MNKGHVSLEEFLDNAVENGGLPARFLIGTVFIFLIILAVIAACGCVVWFFQILCSALVHGAIKLLWLIPWAAVVAILASIGVAVTGGFDQ